MPSSFLFLLAASAKKQYNETTLYKSQEVLSW